MTRAAKISLGLAVVALVSSWILIGYGFSRLGQLVDRRNTADQETFEQFQKNLQEQMEARFTAEHQDAAQKRSDFRAEIREDTAEAKELAKKALTRPQTAVLVSPKIPLPVRVVTPASMPPSPTVVPSPTISDTNPKHGGFIDLFRSQPKN